jgi:predicted MFS family arabinose efflux permease
MSVGQGSAPTQGSVAVQQSPPRDPTDASAAQEPGISRGLVLLLAVTVASAVGNLYYAQPLLHTLAHAFGVSTATAGLLVTISQIGYVFGLAFLVPLGDLVERRGLVVWTLACVGVAQGIEAVAPNFGVFAAVMMLVGVGTFIVQVIVPMSSHLAAEHERGKVVGMVMSGLLIGILLARTVSGIIASLLGWRAVFGVAAGTMLLMAVVLRKMLPVVHPTSNLPYRQALRSVVALVREEPLLRQRMVVGACSMGCFSVLWTALAFLLSGAHGSSYHYGNAAIGLFGLAGAGGAAAAQVVGRLADRGHGRLATSTGIILIVISWGVLALGQHSVVVLIIGIIVLDMGAQSVQISNQSAIYMLRPEARSRLTTAYMVFFFIGGVLLSSVTGALYAADGWQAVCVLGAATMVFGLLVWVLTWRIGSPTVAAERSRARLAARAETAAG